MYLRLGKQYEQNPKGREKASSPPAGRKEAMHGRKGENTNPARWQVEAGLGCLIGILGVIL